MNDAETMRRAEFQRALEAWKTAAYRATELDVQAQRQKAQAYLEGEGPAAMRDAYATAQSSEVSHLARKARIEAAAAWQLVQFLQRPSTGPTDPLE